MLATLSWILVTLELVARLWLAIRVIMRRHTVPATLIWLFLLIFFPIISIIAYFLVGESRLGRRRVKRYASLTEDFQEHVKALLESHAKDSNTQSDPYADIAKLAHSVGRYPPLPGNHLELIDKTDAFIDRLIEDIDNAEHSCRLLFYIWMCGGAGDRVGRALINAAKRGVACQVLVDSVGSHYFINSDMYNQMRQAGIDIREAVPVRLYRLLFARIDVRNHRKIVIIDDSIAYTGSHNITDTTFGCSSDGKVGPWIDCMLRIQGPAMAALNAVFLCDWWVESPDDQDAPTLSDVPPEIDSNKDTSTVQVVPTGPHSATSTLYNAVIAACYQAKDELIITTPYFVLDEPLMSALETAAKRGVHVQLIVPECSDKFICTAASRAHYLDLLEAGVHISLYTKGLLHAKTITIDSRLALFGSANFDQRSFRLNFEITLFVYDHEFAHTQRDLQMRYAADSKPVTLDHWRARPFHKRFLDNTAKLFGPLL